MAAKTAAQKAADEKGKPEKDPVLKQRKVGRGSTRRINRALTNFEEAVEACAKELDMQIYLADEDGKRVGPWEMVSQLREMAADVKAEVFKVTNPEPEAEPEAETPA